MNDYKKSIFDKIFESFIDKFLDLGGLMKKFTDIKKWKEKNRKLFVLTLPISLSFYLGTIVGIALMILMLTVLFLGAFLIPVMLCDVIFRLLISFPLLFWEIYTGKQSRILSDLWRK